jgi:hypothetical protein
MEPSLPMGIGYKVSVDLSEGRDRLNRLCDVVARPGQLPSLEQSRAVKEIHEELKDEKKLSSFTSDSIMKLRQRNP